MLNVDFEPSPSQSWYNVAINNRTDTQSRFSSDIDRWAGDIFDPAMVAELIQHSFEELSQVFSFLTIPAPDDWRSSDSAKRGI